MRKYIVLIIIFLGALALLGAEPFSGKLLLAEKASYFSAIALQDGKIYVADTGRKEILFYDLLHERWHQSGFRLPDKANIIDMYIKGEHIYVWDAQSESIIKYSEANRTRPEYISLKSSAITKMKKGLKLAVNYQGFIYLLDSEKLICLGPEGMLIAARSISNPNSMSLAEDQNIYVVSNSTQKKNHFDLVRYDLFLKDTRYVHKNVNAEYAGTEIQDIAVNAWGEIQTLITGKRVKLKRWSPTAKWIATSEMGQHKKKPALMDFWQPDIIKCDLYENRNIIAVLDTKQKAIHIAEDTVINQGPKLTKPSYTMRPALQSADLPNMEDYKSVAGGYFAIVNTAKLPGKKPDTVILHRNSKGETVYTISLNQYKKSNKNIAAFDALEPGQDYLYVLDMKKTKVHIFNIQDGSFVQSFGEKGKQRDAQFMMPVSMACGDDGMLYLLDQYAPKIILFTAEGVYRRHIDLLEKRARAEAIRILDNNLYCLYKDRGIVKIPITEDKNQEWAVIKTDLSSFDVAKDLGLLAIDAKKQSLEIYGKDGLNYSFLSKGQSFPHFEQIYLAHFDETHNRIVLMDKSLPNACYLHLFPALDDAPRLKMRILADDRAELYWDKADGINKWELQVYQDSKLVNTLSVNKPDYKIETDSTLPTTYIVRTQGDDGLQGPESESLVDYYSYAEGLRKSARYQSAISYYDEAYRVHPDDKINKKKRICHIYEYEYFKGIKDYQRAHNELDKAWEILPEVDIAIKKCELFDLETDYKAGSNYLLKTLDNYQSSVELTTYYVKFAFLDEDYSLAIIAGEQHLKKERQDTEVIRIVAESYRNEGNIAKAVSWYEELLKVVPDFDTEFLIAELLLELEDFDRAEIRLKAMPAKYEQDQDQVNYLLGKLYYKQEKYSRAVEAFTDAKENNPAEAEYSYHLGLAYEKNNMPIEALRELRFAHQKKPAEIRYAFSLAEHLKIESADEALGVLQTSEKHLTARDDRSSFYQLQAELLHDAGRLDEAYDAIGRALQYQPEDEAILDLAETINISRAQQNPNLMPLKIEVSVNPIFPALNMNYEKKRNPIGTISLKNERTTNIENIEIKVSVTGLSHPIPDIKVSQLSRKQSSTRNIYQHFKDDIFSGISSANLSLDISYRFEGKTYNDSKNTALEIKRTGAMDWENRSMLACFVNPEDGQIYNFTRRNILGTFAGKQDGDFGRNIAEAIKVYSFFKANNLFYAQDAIGANQYRSEYDDVQFPHITLNNKSGDCEDLVVLFAACLGSSGVSCGFLDLEKHVVLLIDSALTSSQEISSKGFDADSFIHHAGKYWLPLETTNTMRLNFLEAWMAGKSKYDELDKAGRTPRIISFFDEHESYLPSSFKTDINAGLYMNQTLAIQYFQQDLENLSNSSNYRQKQNFEANLERYPDNITQRLNYADFLANKMGNNSEAIQQYQLVIQKDPNNFLALLNLGNLHRNMNNVLQATECYNRALPNAKNTRHKDLVNLGLCILYYRDQQRSRAQEYFHNVEEKELLKEFDFEIYSNLNSQR